MRRKRNGGQEREMRGAAAAADGEGRGRLEEGKRKKEIRGEGDHER